MEWSTVSVATGALGSVIEKLTTLLGKEQYKSHLGTVIRSDMEFIKSKLASLHSILLRIWEREDLGAECMEWMTEARALSYDMEDDIDDLMLALEHSDIGDGELNKFFRNLKMRVEAVSRRCREEWKPAAPDEAISISISEKLSKPSPADPRARFLHKDASELVGMDRPSRKLQRVLQSGYQEMVCIIHGFAGTGKTTLADFVYHKMRHEFECCAFVSLSKSPDMLEVLGAILAQVTEGVNSVERTCTEATPEENLIYDISMFLSGKRYLIIVDDIWLWRSWEIIRRALPNGNQKCRIIVTTRVNAIAEKCCLTDEGATIYRHSGIDDWAAAKLSRATLDKNASHNPLYKSAAIKLWPDEGEEENVPYLLLLQEPGDEDAAELRRRRILNPVVALERHQRNREFYLNRIIADMCCGMALAVRCLSSASVASLDYYKWWKPVDDKHRLQKKLWHVLLGGLLSNDPALEPMVESLRLGYDDLPVHLKTCFLYCSIFPASYEIERHGLVRKWIAQGFFPQGPEQEKEAAAEACLDELVSRGLLQQEPASPAGEKTSSYCSVHPMMLAFLLWRSKQHNFATCFELPPHHWRPSYAAAAGFDAVTDTILSMDGSSRARSLVVFGYPSSSSSRTHTDDVCLFPWRQLECVRVLSIEDNRVPLCDADLVAICSQMTRLRYLSLKGMPISILPPEIGRLQNLETLDVRDTRVEELPRELGRLHHLKTLKVTAMVRELPWLSSSSASVLVGSKEVEFPRGVSAIMQSWKKEDSSVSSSPVKPGDDVFIVLYVPICQPLLVPGLRLGSRHIRVPKWIKKHLADVSYLDIRLCKLEEDDLDFLRTMPNLQLLTLRLLYLPRENIVLPGTWFPRLESFCLDWCRGHMRVPGWVKQHLAKVSSLDIRLCKLDDDDMYFLREMPELKILTLRLEVVPRRPIVIRGGGFSTLKSFCLDCRLPLVTFQQGAMAKLEHLKFKFYASRALSNDPMGIRHLESLEKVILVSSRHTNNSPSISAVINKVREEAKEHPNRITISINGNDEEVIRHKKKVTVTGDGNGNIIPVESYY